ncbi:MAG TPA: TetR/AcrR family transcriptional regulator, partial [Acidimicrobiia bacterium]|nr:TetR/AcrR family transcriptional regulator [Acidimicrobiia bacterium]
MGTRKLDRERQILDVAADLFRQRGYQGMRMDDLAEAVKLNKGTLYHYFSSKAELLYRIYRDTATEMIETMRALPADAAPDELLARIVEDISRAIERRRNYVTVFFQEMHWIRQWLAPEHFEEIDAIQVEFRNTVTGVIERGVKEGVFRPVDASVVALGIIGMAGWTYQWYAPGGRYSMDDVAGIFGDLVLRSLRRDDRDGPAAPRRAVGR